MFEKADEWCLLGMVCPICNEMEEEQWRKKILGKRSPPTALMDGGVQSFIKEQLVLSSLSLGEV